MASTFRSILEILQFIAGQNESVFGASIFDRGVYINRRGGWDEYRWAEGISPDAWKKEYAALATIEDIGEISWSTAIDRGVEIPNSSGSKPVRFRSSFTHGCEGWELVIRQLPTRVLPDSMVRLPPELVDQYVDLKEGLVLVCGATGSGKSATMTFLNDRRLRARSQKLITAENPIEFVYDRYESSFVRQREVGRDTKSFLTAIREAMRQDPDMIMVQEIRTPDEAVAAMDASLTGHVVIGSIHAFNPVTAIQRYKSFLELASGGAADMIALGAAVKIVIAQQLQMTGSSVAPIHEIMVAMGGGVTQAICNADFNSMKTAIETGTRHGMITFDRSRKLLEEADLYSPAGF
jgi:Tfp pilus assembly pilus retraction ATPase PilT